MNIFYFHPATHEFIGPGVADPSPLVEGEWILPAFTTEQSPPSTAEHQVAIFNEGAWTIEADYRGHTYWLGDGTKITIDTIGTEPPEGALDAPPLPPLADQKLTAISLVKALAKQHIEAGYQSDALGTTHTYPSNLEYQTNIIGAKEAGVALTFLCADENQVWTRRQHSAAELAQVFADGVLRKSTLLDAMDAIVADINGAADQAALDAIDITTGWPE